ncbi:helix-turn-helix domain-containing protein [Flavicella sediminum]|uniref:helix-turn-helix domain-containing protein n=1 Tax=Flavicella sediminum TaxID=2585141 RepID=UPI0011222F9D|nr:helix-turn-helix domain-containing protein [Flavicella sediminum]
MKNKFLQIESISFEELLEGMSSRFLNELKLILKEKTEKSKIDTEDEFITSKDACDILKITLPTLAAWRKSKIVISYRIGNKIRFKKSEILSSLKRINY